MRSFFLNVPLSLTRETGRSARFSNLCRFITVTFMSATLLSGCSGFRLHDPGRAATSTAIKTQYETVSPQQAIATERENLALLLAAELKAVDENRKIDRDYAVLQIANDRTAMGDAVNEVMADMLPRLGIEDAAALKAFVLADFDSQIRSTAMDQFASAIWDLIGQSPKTCRWSTEPAESLALAIDSASEVSPDNLDLAEGDYEQWLKHCKDFRTNLLPTEGIIQQRYASWQNAVTELTTQQQEADKIREKLREAKNNYEEKRKALIASRTAGAGLEAQLRNVAYQLQSAINSARKLGIASGANIDAISTVLLATAASSKGKVDTDDPKLKLAAEIAGEIPSLAGAMAQMIATSKAPSVSGLLIEMQHQEIQAARAKGLETLKREEIAILRAGYDSVTREAGQLFQFWKSACSYGTIDDEKTHITDGCKSIAIDADKKTCTFDKGQPHKDCVLVSSWSDNLAKAKGEPKRELYKTLGAYLSMLSANAESYKQTYYLIDLEQRRLLLSRAAAIESWHNLVGVPIEQIEAYYMAGIKPEELADFMVKAYAATAIALGLAL